MMTGGSVACCGLAVAVLAVVVMLPLGITRVQEGNVAVVYHGGALSKSTLSPGIHWTLPYVTSTVAVPIVMQTARIPSVECGTSGGVTVYFDMIEVVHRLLPNRVYDIVKAYSPRYADIWIHDRTRAEINELCSRHTLQDVYITLFDDLDDQLKARLGTTLAQWTPGLEVVSIRVTKPRIPAHIQSNYETVEAIGSQRLVLEEKQRNALKQVETEARRQVLVKEKQMGVSAIDMARKVNATADRLRIGQIEAKMYLDREKGRVDALFYKMTQEAQQNKRILTPEYLEYLRVTHSMKNMKMYMGTGIPRAIIEEEDNWSSYRGSRFFSTGVPPKAPSSSRPAPTKSTSSASAATSPPPRTPAATTTTTTATETAQVHPADGTWQEM